mgnify:CR=1 FL=1
MEWEIDITTDRKRFYKKQNILFKFILLLALIPIYIFISSLNIGVYINILILAFIFIYFNHVLDKYYKLEKIRYIIDDKTAHYIKNGKEKIYSFKEMSDVYYNEQDGVYASYKDKKMPQVTDVADYAILTPFSVGFVDKKYSHIYLRRSGKISTLKKILIDLEVPEDMKEKIFNYLKEQINTINKNL